MSKKNNCLTCCNENEQYMIYDCYHVISTCNSCYDKLKVLYKCPICRKESTQIKKCYII